MPRMPRTADYAIKQASALRALPHKDANLAMSSARYAATLALFMSHELVPASIHHFMPLKL